MNSALRRPRRSGGRVLVLAAAARGVPGQALPRPARPFDLVVTVRERAPSSLRPGLPRVRTGAAARRGHGLARPAPPRRPRGGRAARRAVERLPLSGRGRARVARVARTAAALAGRTRSRRARRRGARLPLAEGARGVMDELALASFAAATESHLVARAAQRAVRALRAAFDGAAEYSGFAALGYRFLAGRSDRLPAAASGDPRSAAWALPARCWRARDSCVGRRSLSSARAPAPRMVGRSRNLGRELAAAGLVVVSGLARGVDGEAHRGALEAGGTTVAVLGCGIDRDYPAAHRPLAREIAEQRSDRHRVRAGRRARPVAVSSSEPDRRRALRRGGGRRGARAERRADHGRPGAGGRTGGVRRSRRDHVCAVGRL